MHSAEAVHHSAELPEFFYIGVIVLAAILVFYLISEFFEDNHDE